MKDRFNLKKGLGAGKIPKTSRRGVVTLLFCAMLVTAGVVFGDKAYLATTNMATTGTYVDANSSNTSSDTNPWYITGDSNSTDDFWTDVNDHVYISEATTEDAPQLVTTITGLTASTDYDIRVVYFDSTTSDDRIQAGFSSSSLTEFYVGDGTSSVVAEIYNYKHYEALIGRVTADTNGEIAVYIDDSISGDSVYYGGLIYEDVVELADVSVSGVGSYNLTAPAGLSGITWTSDSNYYAIDDSGANMVPLTINVNATTGAISSASAGTAITLATGTDLEGIAYDPYGDSNSGSVFASDEVGPEVREYKLDGTLIAILPTPSVFNSVRINKGFESLTMLDGGEIIWAANEEALTSDGELASFTAGTVVRLQRFTLNENADGYVATGQWAYEVDEINGDAFGTDGEVSGLSDLCVLPDGQLLALERQMTGPGLPEFVNRIYEIDFADATNVATISELNGATYTKVGKTLLWEGTFTSSNYCNYEGITLGIELTDGSYSLLMISDGDDGSATISEDLYALKLTLTMPDTTAPNPDPMTWATDPYATSTSSISMTATTATDDSNVEYYFTCTAGSGNDSSWQDSTTYEDTGLTASTQYTYTVKARDKSDNQNETVASTAKSATTDAADTTAPTPNPLTWATVPYATGTTSISMTATTATDASGVEYYFTCTAGGGNDSGWQDSTTYEDTGLTANTQYTYTATTRDKSAAQNTGTASSAASATTDAGAAIVFADSFESSTDWSTEWSAYGSWNRVTARASDGSYSAEIDGDVTDSALVSRSIDVTGKSSATITFQWYIESGLDAGDYIAFDTDTGSGWVQKADLQGNVDTENAWASESIVVDVSSTNTLTLRFRGNIDKSNEDAYVDVVEVTCE